MRIIADTNVLVRALVGDDARQTRIAQSELSRADVVALAMPALCELVWVLTRGYRYTKAETARALQSLIDAANVVADRPAVRARLAVLAAGGDFADGAIAHDGAKLGGDVFVSFDRKATKAIEAQRGSARLL